MMMMHGHHYTWLAIISNPILFDQGADMEAKDDKNMIPLHCASTAGHLQLARLLLDCGADINTSHRR
jgi:ankyrin repeat protein